MRNLFFLPLFLIIFQLKAQFSESIVSDRPSQTFSPNTVGKGVLQFQNGLGYFWTKTVIDAGASSGSFFTATIITGDMIWDNQIRYGINERWEIDAGLAYRWGNFTPDASMPQPDPAFNGETRTTQDFSRLELGLRHNLIDGGENGLSLGGMVSANLYDYYNRDFFDYLDLRIMASLPFSNIHQISSNLTLRNGNAGYLLYTLNYNLRFGRFSPFVELYGDTRLYSSIGQNTTTYVYFNFGASYRVCDAFQWDFQAGLNHPYSRPYGEQEDTKAYFIGTGISWRILTN